MRTRNPGRTRVVTLLLMAAAGCSQSNASSPSANAVAGAPAGGTNASMQSGQSGQSGAAPVAGRTAGAVAGSSSTVAGRSGTSGGAAGMSGIGAGDEDAGITLPGAGGSSGAAGDGAAGASSAITCPAVAALSAGDHMSMLEHGGTSRQYIVHVPSSYDGKKAVPLVLDFHGWTSSASAEEGASGWREKSDAIGFIAVYPVGLDASWNGGALCCGTSQSSGVDDEGFALDVVKKMESDACIDPKRVYVTGISNGGAMSHLLACKHADVFAAAAPISMGNGTTPCKPSRPISIVMVRGQMDMLVAYNGGQFPSAKADFDMWKGLDGCMGTAMATHQVCQTYSGCNAGTEVTLCSLPNGEHNVYQDKSELSLADVVWETFERQLLP